MKDLERATVYESKDKILVTGHGRILQTVLDLQQENIFAQEWQIEMEYIGNINILAEAFSFRQAVAVSDGSYMEETGAATWTIKATTASNQIVGTGYTPSSATDQSAYCSELFGLWGILHTVLEFTKVHSIDKGAVTIACNSLSALKQAQYTNTTDPNLVHYDLISAIQNIWKLIPLEIKFEHVKGHQDNGQSLALLQTAWMNIEMDKRAKRRAQYPYSSPAQYTIPFKGWQCSIQGQRILKQLPTKL